jgi:hypothetical protein
MWTRRWLSVSLPERGKSGRSILLRFFAVVEGPEGFCSLSGRWNHRGGGGAAFGYGKVGAEGAYG